MLILILISYAFSLSSDCQFRIITDCLEFNMFNLKYECQIKNNRCIKKRNQIQNSISQGIIQLQQLTQEERLESRKGIQKRKSKVIKNQLSDEYSEQFFGPSLSISGSQSGELFDNIELDSYYSYDYPTFEDEESSLDIEFIPKNPIPNQPPGFTITPVSSMQLIVSIFFILLQWIQL
ncbi:unnamed protein product [Paramecium sonneborni]|nr:unnamed protein product [Paramecium sonneborni]